MRSISTKISLAFFAFFAFVTMGESTSEGNNKRDGSVLPYSTPSCGSNTKHACKFTCRKKPHCQDLGFDRSKIPCSCPAQICPDGKIYAYYSQKPLTDEELSEQPHVRATCFPHGCVPAAIAPFHKQIGVCTPPEGTDPEPNSS
ncbi:uncharacterized protein FA14DRAFT_180621 [Meira miltonrushii]|uniref:Long chronological lifespan protein 2 n=1 Tax=Meira miltonrushii TaxID=1280837 RepID=A0A316VES7_9BASI|nr:uncharacterized protein FA14DRAFT_180621 [Meira miltonrushii]PWN33985.1 hypothetical protein FA14DRAFT_180621 [Meira miltonrushii]